MSRNISWRKNNQAMKLSQLIEYINRNIFLLKNYAENKARRLVPDLLLFLKKFQSTSIALSLACNKNKSYKTLDKWSRDMLNFNFSEKGLGLVSPLYFVHDFSRKLFLLSSSINWLNFILWLPLLLEILSLSIFPFTNIHESQDCMWSERAFH